MVTRTWPRLGSGRANSRRERTSGPPKVSYTIARIEAMCLSFTEVDERESGCTVPLFQSPTVSIWAFSQSTTTPWCCPDALFFVIVRLLDGARDGGLLEGTIHISKPIGEPI